LAHKCHGSSVARRGSHVLMWDFRFARTWLWLCFSAFPLLPTPRISPILLLENYPLMKVVITSYSFSMALQPLWALAAFSVPSLYTVGRTPWTSDQPVVRPLPTQRTTQTQNKRTQTSMPWVGFEPTMPAFERAKTVHALHRAVTDWQSLLLLSLILVVDSGLWSKSSNYLYFSTPNLLLDPQNGGSGLLRNVGKFLPDYMVPHPKR
jgi:hypothetical protein